MLVSVHLMDQLPIVALVTKEFLSLTVCSIGWAEHVDCGSTGAQLYSIYVVSSAVVSISNACGHLGDLNCSTSWDTVFLHGADSPAGLG